MRVTFGSARSPWFRNHLSRCLCPASTTDHRSHLEPVDESEHSCFPLSRIVRRWIKSKEQRPRCIEQFLRLELAQKAFCWPAAIRRPLTKSFELPIVGLSSIACRLGRDTRARSHSAVTHACGIPKAMPYEPLPVAGCCDFRRFLGHDDADLVSSQLLRNSRKMRDVWQTLEQQCVVFNSKGGFSILRWNAVLQMDQVPGRRPQSSLTMAVRPNDPCPILTLLYEMVPQQSHGGARSSNRLFARFAALSSAEACTARASDTVTLTPGRQRFAVCTISATVSIVNRTGRGAWNSFGRMVRYFACWNTSLGKGSSGRNSQRKGRDAQTWRL